MIRKTIITVVLPLVVCGLLCFDAQAQDGRINTINTAVPFLLIDDNARTAGIGGVSSVASEGNYFDGATQNPALLSRNKKAAGVRLAYTPWLILQISDIYLFSFSGHYSFDELNAFGFVFNYFSLGTITFTDIRGENIGEFHPYEFMTGIRYARTLGENLSLGLGFKYIYSNLAAGQQVSGVDIHPGMSIAADMGLDHRTYHYFRDLKIRWDKGLSILNLGNKITYTNSIDRDFIPSILKIGTMGTLIKKIGYLKTFYFDLAYQADKLLVPTPSTEDSDNNRNFDYKERSVAEGAIASFHDAPGGTREELNEVMHMLGIEGRIKNKNYSISVRSGAFYEHRTKGNRKYLTAGAGISYLGVHADFSIIIDPQNEPGLLDGIYRLQLGYDFERRRKARNVVEYR